MRWRRLAVMGAVLTLGAAPASDPTLPAWLAGCWQERAGTRWTEECWMPPRGGMMLGTGRSGAGDIVREWEATQIVLGDVVPGGERARMVYWASPGGSNRTAFAWRPDNGPGVTFYNAAHDYPQRIRYWRDGSKLIAETALADGSKAKRWQYRRETWGAGGLTPRARPAP